MPTNGYSGSERDTQATASFEWSQWSTRFGKPHIVHALRGVVGLGVVAQLLVLVALGVGCRATAGIGVAHGQALAVP